MRVPLLAVRHLTRETADGARVIDDVSFDVDRGEVVAIVGESGAGKSSLLRLLNRLDEPTAGTILVDGVDYRGLSPQDLRRRVGMVLQTPHLFAATVADNVRWGPNAHGEDLPDSAVDDLLDRVGLGGYADRAVDTLSGGEAQRVSLARTLANRPQLLLLDEPTSALDQATVAEVEATLVSLFRADGLTCLVITHDADQALRLAGRTLVLSDGRVVRDGETQTVLGAGDA